MTSTRGPVLRVMFPILLVSSQGFLSISLSCVSSRGGRAMWEMKRGLCFPAEAESWIWISLGSGELLLLCTSLIILPLRACLCLHIFPPSIVLQRTELMRLLLADCPHILHCPSSSLRTGRAQSQHPTFFSSPSLDPNLLWSSQPRWLPTSSSGKLFSQKRWFVGTQLCLS